MGAFDLIFQRFIDAFICIPMIIVYLTAMSFFGGGMLQLILLLGITGAIGGTRGSRAFVIWIKESAYVDAARTVGGSTWRVIWCHLIRNIMPMILLKMSVSIGGMILAEAGLSFLGFGLPPPIPSWGGMLSGNGRTYMYNAPWLAIWPGVALGLTIWGMNMFGDALRDLIDPRLSGGIGGIGSYGMFDRKKGQKLLEKFKKRGERSG